MLSRSPNNPAADTAKRPLQRQMMQPLLHCPRCGSHHLHFQVEQRNRVVRLKCDACGQLLQVPPGEPGHEFSPPLTDQERAAIPDYKPARGWRGHDEMAELLR